MSNGEFRSDIQQPPKKVMAGLVSAVACGYVGLGYLAYQRLFDFNPLGIPQSAGKVIDAGPIPEAVRSHDASVVAIEYPGAKPHHLKHASGVIIGPNLVLTAGHEVIDDRPRPYSCAASGVYGLNTRVSDRNYIAKWAASVEPLSNLKGEDIALTEIKGSRSFRSLPSVRIANRPMKRGDVVTFTNDETDEAGHHRRYPNAEVASLYKTDQKYGRAVTYAGVVIGRRDSAVVVATSLKSYGSHNPQEIDSHPGGSGGLVSDASGALTAILIRTDANGAISASDIAKFERVKLPLKGDQKVQISYVQPVTKELVDKYKRALSQSSTPASKSAGQITVNQCVSK